MMFWILFNQFSIGMKQWQARQTIADQKLW